MIFIHIRWMKKSGLIVYKRINRSREPNDLYRVDTLEFIEE